MTRMDRFGDRDDRIEAMMSQKIVQGYRPVAEAIVAAGELVGFAPGEELMRQGGTDADCWFLLSGSVDIVVNGEKLPYGRQAGEVVGEFAAINPRIRRTATVVAREEVVAIRCSSAALKAAGRSQSEVWRLLAIELTQKIEQRNQLIAIANERPRIFMIAAENRKAVAEQIRLALSVDYDVELWSDEDLVPPGGYQLDTLHDHAKAADFGVVLAHPDDLREARDRIGGTDWETVRFELGYIMSELSRHRTLLLIPNGDSEEGPRLFKGMQPMTYRMPDDDVPPRVALVQTIEAIREFVSERKVRSRLRTSGKG